METLRLDDLEAGGRDLLAQLFVGVLDLVIGVDQRVTGVQPAHTPVRRIETEHTARLQDPAQEIPIRPYAGPPNLYAATAPEPDLFEELKLGATGPQLKRWHPIYNCYLKSPLYCAAHHNSVGCGSLKADYMFIFGSCRQFYGEPCFKGPNPYPHPWWNKLGGSCPNCQ